MTLSPELQLVLLALGLYLQDALLLLHPQEAILTPGSRGTWQLGFSADNARIGGRQLFLPNLLTVHQPLFRGRWDPAVDPDTPGEDWSRLRSRYHVLAPLVVLIALLLFVLLPAALLLHAPLALTLGLVGLIYLTILLALSWLYRQRKALGLAPRRLAGLMLECLLCPPIAANLVRRLSLQVPIRQDLLHAARQQLLPADWAMACLEFRKRLEEMTTLEEPGSTRHRLAVELLAQLNAEPDSLPGGLRP